MATVAAAAAAAAAAPSSASGEAAANVLNVLGGGALWAVADAGSPDAAGTAAGTGGGIGGPGAEVSVLNGSERPAGCCWRSA
jgi:hypothetical protein